MLFYEYNKYVQNDTKQKHVYGDIKCPNVKYPRGGNRCINTWLVYKALQEYLGPLLDMKAQSDTDTMYHHQVIKKHDKE